MLPDTVLALSLDQPDSGVAPISKLMDDSVAILVVGDGVPNISWMIATWHVTFDVFNESLHRERGVSIQPGVMR